MLLAVALWTAASTAHAWVGGFLGFAVARAFLGFGEGAAFPGAFRTAMEALPVHRQARGMALGYSGASMGALITPILVIPFALRFGWRAAFLVTGVLGVLWMLLWAGVARPPHLPAAPAGTERVRWPDLRDRRVWVVASSFGLGGLALGVAAYLSPLYLTRAMGLTQADLAPIAWIPMLGWEIGYFFWGWVADRWAARDPHPARIFLLLTLLTLPVAFMTLATHWTVVVALFFWSTFVADGFVVLSLRVGSVIFPNNQAAMVAGLGSASWGLVQAAILPVYGVWFDRQWYGATFLSMALLPACGTLLWLWLSRPWAEPVTRPAPGLA
jgi:ACS family hexuronate transporter-like MFS transporter